MPFFISGLAREIDTVAHEAAIKTELRTVAVLAGEIQHTYPPENQNLAEKSVNMEHLPVNFF